MNIISIDKSYRPLLPCSLGCAITGLALFLINENPYALYGGISLMALGGGSAILILCLRHRNESRPLLPSRVLNPPIQLSSPTGNEFPTRQYSSTSPGDQNESRSPLPSLRVLSPPIQSSPVSEVPIWQFSSTSPGERSLIYDSNLPQTLRNDNLLMSHMYYLHWIFKSTLFVDHFLYLSDCFSEEAVITISSLQPLETCTVNLSALEKIALHYRNDPHHPISLFVIEKKDFEGHLHQEISQRKTRFSPYFGFLVVEKTPTGLFSLPLLFSTIGECQCCIMQPIDLPIQACDSFYRNILQATSKNVICYSFKDPAADDPIEKLGSLALSLFHLNARTPHQPLSTLVSVRGPLHFHPLTVSKGHLPDEWTLFEEFRSPNRNNDLPLPSQLPPQLRNPSLLTYGDFINHYKRDIPYQMTFRVVLFPEQEHFLSNFFSDPERRTSIACPEGIDIQWDQTSSTLNFTINYTRPHNRASYELGKAHHQMGLQK